MKKSVRRRYEPGTFDLKVGRSYAGLGLFAGTDPIPKDACVIEYVGKEVSEEEQYTSQSRYLFEITKKRTIDGKPKWNKAGYINHSHKPNCEPTIHKGRIFIFAKRAIAPGEELTYDYGKEYAKEYCNPCKCPPCRAKEEKQALLA